MTNIKYLVVVLLLYCLRDCSGNNSDPCLNPANQNLIVPFRQVVTTNSDFYTPYGDGITLYDSTHCYLLQIYSFAISQTESNIYAPSSQASISGYLRNTCNNGTQLDLLGSESTNTALLNFPSSTLLSVNTSPLFYQGTLSNGSYSWTANITFDAATYTSNITKPSTAYQRDEYVTYDNSPCTVRIRLDQVERYSLYSPNIPLTIRLYNGTLLQFNYPAGIRTSADRRITQKYYQQCTCAQSSSDAQSTAANQYLYSPPNIAGVRTASSC